MADPTPEVPLPGSGGSDSVVFRQAPDGRLWQSEDGGRTWTLAPPQFQPSAQGPLAGLDPLYGDGEVPYYLASPEGIGQAASYVDPATGLLYDRSGKLLPQWAQLALAGSYGGGGGGGGLTAYEAAQLARQEQQDRVERALAILNAMTEQQAAAERRQQAAQQLMAAAAAYAVDPRQQYFAGLGPDDPAVRLGLAQPLRTRPVTLSPGALLAGPYDGRVQAALAQLGQAAGMAV